MNARSALAVLMGVLVLAYYLSQSWPAGSVKGEDRNRNGVWDDIDLRIARLTSIASMRLAAEQEARIYQRILLNPENALELVSDLNKAMDCVEAIQSEHGQDLFGPVQMRDLVITTRARERAWMKFNAGLSGGVYPGIEERRSACEF